MEHKEDLQQVQGAVKEGKSVLVIGSKGSGKTVLVKGLLEEIPVDKQTILVGKEKDWQGVTGNVGVSFRSSEDGAAYGEAMKEILDRPRGTTQFVFDDMNTRGVYFAVQSWEFEVPGIGVLTVEDGTIESAIKKMVDAHADVLGTDVYNHYESIQGQMCKVIDLMVLMDSNTKGIYKIVNPTQL
ncbi:ATP-binding cassette domain-containing protein [Bacillus sp. NEAU-Y102]